VFNFAAVTIKNAITKISFGVTRWGNPQNLIAPNTKLAMRNGSRLLGCEGDGLAHTVKYNKIVAGAMHFCKRPDHVAYYR
jgi:hypothetical protein